MFTMETRATKHQRPLEIYLQQSCQDTSAPHRMIGLGFMQYNIYFGLPKTRHFADRTSAFFFRLLLLSHSDTLTLPDRRDQPKEMDKNH